MKENNDGVPEQVSALDPKTTDYCGNCGESPASASHVLPGGHSWVSGAELLPVDDGGDGPPVDAALVALREMADYFHYDRPLSALKLREIVKILENEIAILRGLAEIPCPECLVDDEEIV